MPIAQHRGRTTDGQGPLLGGDPASVSSSGRTVQWASGAREVSRSIQTLAFRGAPAALPIAKRQEGRLGVRHEHLMTDLMTTELRHLFASLPEPSGPRVLLATLPNEQHRIALDLFALDLASAGVTVTILGADTPPSETAKAAVALEVDVVGLLATAGLDLDKTRRGLEELILELPRRVRIWLGGPAATVIEMQDLEHFASYRELDREIGRLKRGRRPGARRPSWAREEARSALSRQYILFWTRNPPSS